MESIVTVPGKARRNFVFAVLTSLAPRIALFGKYPEKDVKGGGRELDTDHPDYVAARQRWVGHADPALATAAVGQLESDILATLTGEAEDRVQQTLRRARRERIPADESAIRQVEFKKVEEFKAKIAEFVAAEVKRDQDRAAKDAKKTG